MEYTVLALCKLAGVTPRTLRYYDQIGLLMPRRKAFTGYRLYGPGEVDRLQQILFYRELGIPLHAVKKILDDPEYNALEELRKHRDIIVLEQKRLDALARNISRTITRLEGETEMTDTEKFEGMKQSLINENERRYGREIRDRYGDKAMEESYGKMTRMSAEQYQKAKELEEQIKDKLRGAMKGSPKSAEAQALAAMHREWLCMYWGSYSPETHENLAQMYVQDKRFKAYYKDAAPGAAEFLRDAIVLYTQGLRSGREC